MRTPMLKVRCRAMWSALLLLTGLTSACASTALVNLWKDPVQPTQPLRRVLVVALRKDATSRRLWEDDFVAALRDENVTARPSYQLFPNAAPDSGALVQSVKGQQFDALLVIHPPLATTETHWVPGYVVVRPVWYPNPWYRRYAGFYQTIYAPSYLESERVLRYETEVWMTEGDGRLVWIGTTRTINPTSASDIHREVADKIIPELIRSGVIRGK